MLQLARPSARSLESAKRMLAQAEQQIDGMASSVELGTPRDQLGYCLGGRLAFMTAARTDSDATVGYYAVGVDNLLREKHAIARPLMLHIPTEDGFVDKDTQKAMHDGLDDHPKVTLHDYEGMDHGFATQFGKRRHDECADLADRRTKEFFAEHLG